MYNDQTGMLLARTQEYIRVVTALEEKYAHIIRVQLGIEQGYYSDTTTEG